MRWIGKLALAASAALTGACASVSRPEPSGVSAVGDYLSARLSAQANAVAQASTHFEAAHTHAPAAETLTTRAFFYHLAAGDMDLAVSRAAEIAAAPDGDRDGLARMVLAAAALKAEEPERARALLREAAFAPYLRSAAYLTDVWIEAALAGPQAAIDRLGAAPEDVFKGFNPLHNALLADKAGANEAAGAAYQVAVLGLGGPVGRAAYGAFLERSGDREAAEEYYRLLLRESAGSRRLAEAGLLRLERRAASDAYGDLDPAEGAAIAFHAFAGVILDQTSEQRSEAEEAGLEVGEPRYDLPLVLAQIALYLDPKFDEARALVGMIFSAYGDLDAAMRALAPLAPASPAYEQAQLTLARALSGADRRGEAIARLRRDVRRDPGARETRLTLSALLAEEDRQAEAVSVLSDLIARLDDPDEDDAWRYYLSRGAALIELGRWPEAEVDLKKAVALAPEEPYALNHLGYSWAERGENLDEAFDLIEKAVELAPGEGAIVDSLGWAHYQRGDYAKAVDYLERAASMEPADATIVDHLGDVYWRLGRRVEARYQWRHALELDAPEARRDEIRRKIEQGLGVPAGNAMEAVDPPPGQDR